jgi:hypothetical protein
LASFEQDQAQFRAHHRFVTCSARNRTSGELITGVEDQIAHVFNAEGRMLAESAARDFVVSSVASLALAKLCLIGTASRLSMTDNRPHLLNTIIIARGRGNLRVARPAPRECGGQRPAALVVVGDTKLVFRESEILADSPTKLILFHLKNSVNDMLKFAESILDFHFNFNHLV